MILPIIHLNGTSKESLLEMRERLYAALGDAEKALCAMVPNGRDFYPSPGLMDQAVSQHQRRLKMLGSLIAEIEQETIAIERLGR
jgi:hypothetical protein